MASWGRPMSTQFMDTRAMARLPRVLPPTLSERLAKYCSGTPARAEALATAMLMPSLVYSLAGVHLDHNALVHVGAVVHIGIFRVVGVHGVGVVKWLNMKLRPPHGVVLIAGADVLRRDVVQNVAQGRWKPRPVCAGTHSFVVEKGGNIDGPGAVCFQKPSGCRTRTAGHPDGPEWR